MALSTYKCPACGEDNKVGSTFCKACGMSLTDGNTLIDINRQLTRGYILQNRYRINHVIGGGGMGIVYQAEDIHLSNRRIAVKEMKQIGMNPQEQANATRAFEREALILTDLQHPNLPNIFDYFEESGRWYLVMSFIEGETLNTYLNHFQEKKLPLNEAVQIGIQLCTVLNYLHTQYPPIILRDLKPANIMRRSQDGHIYLIDFGIARFFKPGQSRDTTIYGTMGYASPEQAGEAQTTPQSDIYSLGATLHQMLTGINPCRHPFQFASLLPASGQASEPALLELDQLITHMLDMDTKNRPASAAEIQQKLENIGNQLHYPQIALTPTQPVPPPPPIDSLRWTPYDNAVPDQILAPFPPINAPHKSPYNNSASDVISPPPLPPINTPAPQPKKRRKLVPIVSLLFLIVSGIYICNFAQASHQHDIDAAATALAVHNTSVAATNTALANATATAAVLAATYPDPYQPAGTFMMMDPLNGPYAWTAQSDTSSGGKCQFVNGMYQINETTPSIDEVCLDNGSQGGSINNFAFEVNMTVNQGDCGGVTIRNNGNNSNDYIFEVCQDGSYRFDKYVSNSNATNLMKGTSLAINQGTDQPNVIAVVANKNILDVYANGQKIDSTNDSAYSQGYIGLIAGDVKDNTTVVYQDAKVWGLPS